MNLSKSFEFFNPDSCSSRIHIVGCGSVGSTVAELLSRFGLARFALYDFDYVEPHNLVNQMFTAADIGQDKVNAVERLIKRINPEADVRIYPKGWDGDPLEGYVFLCVDNIDLRRRIVEENKYNSFVKAMFDFRTGLTDAQHYAADWTKPLDKKAFLGTMNFTHEEAKLNTTLSACNVEMCVAPTVRMIANVGVVNFINLLKGEHMYKQITLDAFNLEKGIDAIG